MIIITIQLSFEHVGNVIYHLFAIICVLSTVTIVYRSIVHLLVSAKVVFQVNYQRIRENLYIIFLFNYGEIIADTDSYLVRLFYPEEVFPEKKWRCLQLYAILFLSSAFCSEEGTEPDAAADVPGDEIDAIRPDLEAFTSLWTALRVNYEGTNITRTVARLLHMYQPEDGVLAYERLLRTLFVLLEDFDSDGLQLLVSMVPPPKGVAEPLVKEVFHRATGFLRVDAPVFHRNMNVLPCFESSATPDPDDSSERTDSCKVPSSRSACNKNQRISQTNTKDPIVDMKIGNSHSGIKSNDTKNLHTVTKPLETLLARQSPQVVPRDSEVFRGFPPNEIYSTQSHVQNINNFYRPGNYGFAPPQNYVSFGQMRQPMNLPSSYRPKWFQSPYLMQKSSYQPYQDFYLKTFDNQYVKVPALTKVNHLHQAPSAGQLQGQSDLSCASQGSYQTVYSNAQEYLRSRSNTVTSGLLEKIQRHRDMQEATVQKIMIDCESYKPASSSNDSQPMKSSEVNHCDSKSADSESRIYCLPSKNNSNATRGSNVRSKPNVPNETNGTLENEEGKIDVEEVSGEIEAQNREALVQFEKEVRKRQRAIQEDIYKMDVVRNAVEDRTEEGVQNREQANRGSPDSLVVTEELRKSLRNFQNRLKNEESVVVPRFSHTRALNDIHEPMVLPMDQWKLSTARSSTLGDKVPKANAIITNSNSNCDVSAESVITNDKAVSINEVSQKEVAAKKVVRRKKPDPPMRPKSQRVAQKGPNETAGYLQMQMNTLSQSSVVSAKKSKTEIKSKCDPQDSLPRCPVIASESTATTNLGQATTMAELAAYKKQYYDALLSIQKAKVAISTVQGNPTGFDPYYFNYLQQQHQHHQHMLMGPRFPQQQSLAGSAPWIRPTEWRYHPAALLPQRPQMLHTPSLWPSTGLGFLARDPRLVSPQQHRVHSVNQQPKPQAKRRKLEEIVGKLKETEINNKNN